MDLTHEEYYLALKARDPRFDGEFFTCVASTGIYCRPICPAITPKQENCTFVQSAAAAEEAGFRPCLRCRPETAPGSPAWIGTGSTVARAMRLLADHDAQGGSLEDLSDRLGVGSRHLRRLIAEQMGASPKSLIQTQRLHIALQLLKESDIAIGDVSAASGFRSIRRFNDAMKKTVGLSPTEFRNRHKVKKASASLSSTQVRISYRPPYDWDALLAYLEFRAIPGVETVETGVYRRAITVDEAVGILEISHVPDRHMFIASFDLDRGASLISAIRTVRDILDTDCRPDALLETFHADATLGPHSQAWPGVRVPGCWSVFELVVRAVIGQQISVKGATTLLGRLAETWGTPIESSKDDIVRLFPTPQQISHQDLTQIGLTKSRAQTLQDVASVFSEDPRFVGPSMPVDEAIAKLTSIKGIGDWTAQYVALRALRYPDAFPSADLGLLKAAGVDKPKDLKAKAEAWRPWRGYAALLLWRSLSLTERPRHD